MQQLNVWRILLTFTVVALVMVAGCTSGDLNDVEGDLTDASTEGSSPGDEANEQPLLGLSLDTFLEAGDPSAFTVNWTVESTPSGPLSTFTLYGTSGHTPPSHDHYESPLHTEENPSSAGSITLPVQEDIEVLIAHVESGDGRTAWSAPHDVPKVADEGPVANAGPDQNVTIDFQTGSATIQLDGSNSNASDASITSYTWFLLSDDDQRVKVGEGQTTEVVVEQGNHIFQLEVFDELGLSGTDSLVVTAKPRSPPVAEITRDDGEGFMVADLDGSGSETVRLNASKSKSAAGEIAQTEWYVNQEKIGEGPTTEVTIHLGDEPEVHQEVTVIVEDDAGLQDTLTQAITLKQNQPPVANLTAPMDPGATLTANLDRTLILTFDASDSQDTDGDGVFYEWTASGSSGSVLGWLPTPPSSPTGAPGSDGLEEDGQGSLVEALPGQDSTFSPFLVLPADQESVDFTVEVTVADEAGEEDTESITFKVEEADNVPPVAEMDVECTYLRCTFDASSSFDPVPNQEIASYQWEIGEDPNEPLTGEAAHFPADGISVSHEFSGPGAYQVNLTVQDIEGLEDEINETITVSDITVSSPSFDHEEGIPARHTCQGAALNIMFDASWYSGPSELGYPPRALRPTSDFSPALEIKNIDPTATDSLALLVNRQGLDGDGPDFNHWTVWNIPADAENVTIPENALPEGANVGQNSHDQQNYRGPCPASDERHYDFTVYALEAPLPLGETPSWSEILDAIDQEGSMLSQSTLRGTYQANCTIPTGAVPLDQLLNVNQACVNVQQDKLQEEAMTVTVPTKVTLGANEAEGPLPGSVTVQWAGYRLDRISPDSNDPPDPDTTWNTSFVLEDNACAGDVCYEDIDHDQDGVPDAGEATLCFAIGAAEGAFSDETINEAGTCRNHDYVPPVDLMPWPMEITVIPSDPLDLLGHISNLVPDEGVP